MGEELGENKMKIIGLINKNRAVSIPELSKKIGISTTAIENNIKKLKQEGILRRVGFDRGGHWETTGKKIKEFKQDKRE